MNQKLIDKMTGYKATDKDMTCRGFKYELGRWYEHDGELSMCSSGFHFCVYPSGVFEYYPQDGTRLFEVEAEQVLDTPYELGATMKKVCKRIRLVKEVTIDGKQNTGDRNTGYMNTGDRNTGNRNTGNMNTGYMNTGDRNTGNRNTGDRNTGYMNTGYMNTGHMNTGNRNTGEGNIGNFHAGFFCAKDEPVRCFDSLVKMSRDKFNERYGNLVNELSYVLLSDGLIDFEQFKNLPGITETKLAKLHKAHIDGRKK